MKHLVINVGEYHPYMSPNGKMVRNLVELLKSRFCITVLTRRNYTGLEKRCMIDGVPVIRIVDMNQIIHNYLAEKISQSNNLFFRFLFEILLLVKRIIFIIPRIVRNRSISGHYIKKIKHELYAINRQNEIDVLLSVSAPHEEVFAGVEFCKEKKQNCKLFIYQMDRYANSSSLYICKYDLIRKNKNNIEMELSALSECKRIFVLPPIAEHYKESIYRQFSNKIIVTEHPLVKKKAIASETENKMGDGKIHVIYAGSLNKKNRNPSYLLEMFNSNIMRSSKVVLDLYTFGDCQDIIYEYQKRNLEKINSYGKVSSYSINKILEQSDILLTIGNNSDNEVPSKLFEYISFLKPIIHLYYSDNDLYLQYLKDYPRYICLKMEENRLVDNVNRLLEFCMKSVGYEISESKILDIFNKCTPEYVSTQFMEEIDK